MKNKKYIAILPFLFFISGLIAQTSAPVVDTEGPNSASGTTHILLPDGGAKALAGNATGAIKITLPVLWTSTMIRMRVEVFNYKTDESFSLWISGYNFASGSRWVNCSAQLLTSSENQIHPVHFGDDGSNTAIWIGESTTTWGFPKVRVAEVLLGHASHASPVWQSGWTIDFDASDFSAQVGTTVQNVLPLAGSATSDHSELISETGYIYLRDQKFYGNNNSRITWYSNHDEQTEFTFMDKQGERYGSIFGSGNGEYFGLLDGDGNWSYLADKDSYTAFQINNSEKMRILHNGNVGIGTTDPKSKLSVDGIVRAKEMIVLPDIAIPDYVFAPDYDLRPLSAVERYIQQYRHLPEIPSAKEIEKEGMPIGEMNALLLKKIEELTLYAIEQEKRLKRMEMENEKLQRRMERIEE